MRISLWTVCHWKLTISHTAGFMIPDLFKWPNRTARFMSNKSNRNRRSAPFQTDNMWSLWIEGEGARGVKRDFFFVFEISSAFVSRAVLHDTLLYILRTPEFHGTLIQMELSEGYSPPPQAYGFIKPLSIVLNLTRSCTRGHHT